jgi:small-conductance mechanosensitive channel
MRITFDPPDGFRQCKNQNSFNRYDLVCRIRRSSFWRLLSELWHHILRINYDSSTWTTLTVLLSPLQDVRTSVSFAVFQCKMQPMTAYDFHFEIIASKSRNNRHFLSNNRLFNRYINASLSCMMNIITMFDLHNAVTLAPPDEFKYFKLSICNASIASLISVHF